MKMETMTSNYQMAEIIRHQNQTLKQAKVMNNQMKKLDGIERKNQYLNQISNNIVDTKSTIKMLEEEEQRRIEALQKSISHHAELQNALGVRSGVSSLA